MSLSNSFLSFGLFSMFDMRIKKWNVIFQMFYVKSHLEGNVMSFLLDWAMELNCSLHRNVTQHLEANLLFCLNRLQFLSKVWIKIELFIYKSHYHFLNNEGVLILKLNANIAYRFNGKIFKFYWLKNSFFWRILLVLTNIPKLWQNGSKYWTLNILNINFKDSILTVLMTYYLDTLSQPNMNWNREKKHKRHNSKSKTKKKALLITEKQSCKNQFTIIALISLSVVKPS